MREQESLKERISLETEWTDGTVFLSRMMLPEAHRIWDARHREDVSRETCRPVSARTPEETEGVLRTLTQGEAVFLFQIEIEENGKRNLAGQISLSDYNPRNQSAELGYYLLPEFRSQGLMKRALKLLVSQLFHCANWNKLYAQTGSFNVSSVRLLKSIGFHCDACLRQHHEWNCILYDDYVYSILCEEWNEAATG